MSDVEPVSLPAALDVGPNNTLAAVKTDGDADTRPSGRPLSPDRKIKAATPVSATTATAAAAPLQLHRDSAGSHPVDEEDDEQGPPSPKADSEAETIIQSGRESLSPEKKRKHIRHDPNRQGVDGVDGIQQRKKPRIDRRDGEQRVSRARSPLDRAGSPPSVVKVEKVDDVPSVSQDVMEERGSSNDGPERPRNYRKRSFSDSVDEKRERRRDSTAHAARDLKHLNHARLSRPSASTRSVSPGRSSHQRSSSGSHLPSKKKAPAPLLTGFQRQTSEDRQSTSSSASGSPLPSAHLRKLGSGVGASASPAAKHMGPKKLRDKSGRTPLARACADRKYDQVVLRYGERPEDLNVPDNAGNTPLQVASLNGEEQIVKFLLDAGCEINTKNIDKDTPLIDAVENGNVDVVKLLLDSGANPRTVNASGDEPYELVPTDLTDDEYDEIRKLLADAKANSRPGRRSEEQQVGPDKPPRSRRASVASPSRSPPPMASTTGRRKTGRSEATRNDLLWTQPTSENLREFAAKGDEQGVVSILNILQKADNASLIAAAKGGHFDVLSLMYAIGDADADPNPLRGSGHKPGYNTPMLAAIGRGNMDNIQLILGQPGFDPTRRLFEDKTYYELSRSRQGENWEEEYDILKKAYENYSGSGKGRKDLSSPRRARGKDKEEKRSARRESSSPVARTKKLNDSSPNANRQRFPKDHDALREKRREEKKAAAATASGRTKTTSRDARDTRDAHDHALASSDHDSGRTESKKPKAALSARRGSESSGVARTDEVRKRRLIAGRRPQDGDRRPSLISSDSLSGREEAPRSRDNPPDSISSLKRIRTDTSPERSRSRDGDSDRLSPEARKKKRRVLAEEKASNLPNGSSRKAEDTNGDKPQHRRPKEETSQSTDPAPRKSTETSKKPEPSSHKPDSSSHPQHTSSQKSTNSDSIKKNGDVKTEPPEPTPNSIPEVSTDDKRAGLEAEKRRQAEVKKAEEERVAEEKRREEEAERARLAKEEAERAAQAAREKAEEEERKRKEMEQRRAKQAEDERQKRLEQERARVIKMRRDQEAQEQRRRDALPGRLRASANFVGSNDPRARSHSWLKNFLPLVTVVTRQLDPGCASDVADEKWIPNYLVAPLLATNDLQLSQYASWEKRKATTTQRMNLWRCTRRMLVYTDDPRYHNASFGEIMQLDCETRPKYFEMEHVFWIRLSDFMDLVPHIPHLNGLDLEFMSMHLDPEPSAGTSHHTNGSTTGTFAVGANGIGALNGHGPGYPRPGTYF
ncbi:uncharacterized protein N7496_009832 [Penicillium cataractarum]|uniref:Histone deacetylase complex subunit (Hos4) n=1 Tax=Penicillium cataractarum TaxID=2100454 RepID=A0A9W9V1C7_9EURO|nr:uncharacterized protein N7496_009832 [Penicillium cataractarum]KAJ5364119.1 hypothetical protein N7496_009832 [Penicillium cataractarum]